MIPEQKIRNLGERFNLGPNNQLHIQPDKITLPLLLHQKTALHEMVALETDLTKLDHYHHKNIKSNIGYISDQPGAGKSLTMLSLIASDHPVKGFWNSNFNALYTLGQAYIDTNIIIVPSNILDQWQEYIKTQTKLTYKVVTEPKRIEFLENFTENITLIPEQLVEPVFKLDIRVKRIVIDEVDSMELNICNTNINLASRFLWFMTATPNRLLEHLPSFGQLERMIEDRKIRRAGKVATFATFPKFMFLSFPRHLLRYIVVKNNEEFVKQSLDLPNPIINYLTCVPPSYVKIIPEFSTCDIEKSLQSHDMETIANLLQCEIESPIDIFNNITNKFKQEIDEYLFRIQYLQQLKEEEHPHMFLRQSRKEQIDSIEYNISKIKTKITSIQERLEEAKDGVCAICFMEFYEEEESDPPVLFNCCHNVICTICVSLLVKKQRSCPYCRAPRPEFTIISGYKLKPQLPVERAMNKIDTVIRLIQQNKEGRFLIFASADGTFKEIVEKLEHSNLPYYILNRHKTDVSQYVERFTKGEIKILMLNATTHGAGLNLQTATDIIITHRLDPYTYEQVIGRAQRLGRKEALRVHYLTYPGER